MNDTLYNTKQMLDLITTQFFVHPTTNSNNTTHYKELHATAEKVRQGMVKVNNAYKEAKYEVSYAYSNSAELNPIRQLLNTVSKHLIILSDSLKTEQMLFNHNDTTSDTNEKKKEKNGVFVEHIQNKSDNFEGEQLNIRTFAKEATNSYMKKGIYIRPHKRFSFRAEENSDLHNTDPTGKIKSGVLSTCMN